MITHSAEYLANLDRYKYFAFLLTYNLNDNRVFSNWEEFNCSDEKLINKLINEAYLNSDINEANIRKLARSEPWRSIWISSCKVGNLFDKPQCEMSDYQKMLVSWSLIYDNVFEHPDCPGDSVIDNDEALDAWLKSQSDERAKQRDQNNADNFLKNDKIRNSGEVGIVVDSVEDAKTCV